MFDLTALQETIQITNILVTLQYRYMNAVNKYYPANVWTLSQTFLIYMQL